MPASSPVASAGVPPAREPRRLPLVVLGMALGIAFAISFVLCNLLYLVAPDLGSGHFFLTLLPYFKFLSWPSFFIGLVESFVLGWYVALVFGPTYNLCVRWFG